MATRNAGRITRGELARLTGVNSETIRYFERIGILAAPDRTEGGHRVYNEGHVRTLGFVRRARSLGFTPKEVQAILDLGGPGRAPCAESATSPSIIWSRSGPRSPTLPRLSGFWRPRSSTAPVKPTRNALSWI